MQYEDNSFLDNEIVRICCFDGGHGGFKQIAIVEDGLNPHAVLTEDSPFTQAGQSCLFRLKWCNHGYKICPVQLEEAGKVLSVEAGNGRSAVVVAPDFSRPEDIWDILPECTSSRLVFRSHRTESIPGTDRICYYLSADSGELGVSTEKDGMVSFQLKSNRSWMRFGEAYLNYLGWEDSGALNGIPNPLWHIRNYEKNAAIGMESINTEVYHDRKMLVFQSGGAFRKLHFYSVKMDNVCCEVMGTYNALSLAGAGPDFFRLALEFEWNAAEIILGIVPRGYWGSDPYKIGNCLEAYHISHRMINHKDYKSYREACDAFDRELAKAKSGIVSYNWPALGPFLYYGIHTYAAVYDAENPEGPVKTFNRFSNHKKSKNYASTWEALHDDRHAGRYLVGFLLY